MNRASLRHWPAGALERKLREERRQRIAEARELADVEIRDGREYRVVRLDDEYGQNGRSEPEIQFHRHSVQLMHDLTRGPNPLGHDAP